MAPIAASTMPGTNWEKKESSNSVVRTKTSLTRRLVEDPINVVIPARIEINESGIIKREALVPSRAAIAAITGINITTTGVLFMNIDTAKATPKTINKVMRGDLSRDAFILTIGPSRAPVWNIP